MSEEFNEITGKIYKYSWKLISDYRQIIAYISVCFSIGSIHFFTYISYFDIDILSLIDASSVASYYWRVLVIYASVVGVMKVVNYVFRHAIYSYFPDRIFGDDEKREFPSTLRNSIFPKWFTETRLGKSIKKFLSLAPQLFRSMPKLIDERFGFYIVVSLVFSYIFVGGFNVKYLIIAILLSVLLLFALFISSEAVSLAIHYDRGGRTNVKNSIYLLIKKFLYSTLPLTAIIVAIFLGFARANYMMNEKTYSIQYNGNSISGSIVLPTQNGIILFEKSKNKSVFVSWSDAPLIRSNGGSSANLRTSLNKYKEMIDKLFFGLFENSS